MVPDVRSHRVKSFGTLFLALLAAVLCLRVSARAAAAPDVKGHWAEATIGRWADSGVLKGYSDGTFRPDGTVTRAQLAEVLYRFWDCAPVAGYAFRDLSPSDWCYESLTTMNAYGIALNQGEQMYPDQPLSREEAIFMIAKAFQIGGEPEQRVNRDTPGDFAGVLDFYSSRVSSMLDKGFVPGAPDGALHPKDAITLAEVMQMMDNIFDQYITKPGSYTVPADQIVLVNCGGVKLTYVDRERLKDPAGARLYIMGDAAEQGVTIAGTEKIWVRNWGVSQGGAKWSSTGACKLASSDDLVLSEYPLPDFRFVAGLGTSRCPYLIKTPEQFRLMENYSTREYMHRKTTYFELLGDIELPGNQAPMGLTDGEGHRFEMWADLAGNGHTVTYHMTNPAFDGDRAGLFQKWAHGRCTDLTLEGSIDLTLSDRAAAKENVYVGGFSGASSAVTMVNCVSNMDITVRYPGEGEMKLCVGGLAGNSEGSDFISCTVGGSVKVERLAAVGNLYVGGLSGAAASTPSGPHSIAGCGSTAEVSVQGGNNAFAGGLVGLLTLPEGFSVNEKRFYTMEHCWSTAQISSSGAGFQTDCGGLIGQMYSGTLRGCWAKPRVTISAGSAFQNMGGISGSCHAMSHISDCWANVSGCVVPGGDGHYGGITGRMDGRVSRCYTLGTKRFAPANAISYAAWTQGPVTACMDMTGTTQAQRDAFYRTCGWDFTGVWDKSGAYPTLRSCNFEAQKNGGG